VLEARDGARPVALKRLLPHLATDARLRRLFEAEAEIGARLHHRNLVELFEAGEMDGIPYLCCELVDGVDLGTLLEGAVAPLDIGVCAFITLEICRALSYLHQAVDADGHALGLVHRDVSPANVLVGRDGAVKLADLGVAKALLIEAEPTRSEVRKGRLEYMAPERIERESLDARADLFACGVLLYRAMAGRPPFWASDEEELIALIRHGEIARPSSYRSGIPPVLEAACMKAIAADRELRFRSADEMAAVLAAFVPEHARERTAMLVAAANTGERTEGTQPTQTASPPARPLPSRSRWVGAIVVILAVTVGIVIAARRRQEARSGPPAAQAAATTDDLSTPPTTERHAAATDPEPSVITPAAPPAKAVHKHPLQRRPDRVAPGTPAPTAAPRRDYLSNPFAPSMSASPPTP
jgi:serine/threonine-protein kinase